jgi:hypothetical protein
MKDNIKNTGYEREKGYREREQNRPTHYNEDEAKGRK